MQTLFDDLPEPEQTSTQPPSDRADSAVRAGSPLKERGKRRSVHTPRRSANTPPEEERENHHEPLSVSGFIEALNVVLGDFRTRVYGEVTSAKRGPTGHWYFSIKDFEQDALLNCVIWRSNYELSGVALTEGLSVIVSGVPDMYAPRGSLTFKTDTIELVGEGALRAAYLKLKEKLTREGLFDESRKRALPSFPQKIGVITSTKSGTVIHDFTNNLGRHGFKLAVCDARVEGAEAVRDLVAAVKTLATRELDVLVVMRGGGSFESLAPFDNEAVVRAFAGFPVPVIAGIGHHEDVTLAALAADAGVSTPTAAAELLNRTWSEAERQIERNERLVFHEFAEILHRFERAMHETSTAIRGAFAALEDHYHALELRLVRGTERTGAQIATFRRMILEAARTIPRRFSMRVREGSSALAESGTAIRLRFMKVERNSRETLAVFERTIQANDPLRQLKLGYSIATSGGKIVRKVEDAHIGAILEVQVADGRVETTVHHIYR